MDKLQGPTAPFVVALLVGTVKKTRTNERNNRNVYRL